VIYKTMKHALAVAIAATTIFCVAAVLVAATPPGAPVADAAMKGDLALVRKLLAQGERVSAPQGDGMTALHWAADRGDSVMAATLIRARADVRAVTRIGGYTPLHIASRSGHETVVVALLKAGSDANALSEAGASALHFAAGSGNVAAVTALLDRGANVNAREPQWGQTPLIFAAAYDRAEVIRVLLARGADAGVHTKTTNLVEEGARDQAATRKRNEVLVAFEPEKHRGDTARTIATAGATGGPAANDSAAGRGGRGGRVAAPIAVPKGPFTAAQVQAAIDSGRVVLAAAPVAGRAFTEQVDTINGGVAGYVSSVGGLGGLSALHHAVREGNLAAVRALLDGGANINDRSGVDSTTPLLLALINGQFDVAKVLIEHGAEANLASTAGLTPLYAVINTQWAPRSRFPQPQEIQNQRTSYLELMAALLKSGANPNARLKTQFWYFSFNNCGNANCGLENIDGTTPFWRAAYAVDVEAMRMLAKAGADPNIPSLKTVVAAGRGGRGRGGAGGDSTAAPGTGGGGPAAGAAGGAAAGGRGQAAPAVAADASIDSAAKAVPPGIGVYPIHDAAGVGYGNGFAGNSHRHAPEGWMPAMRYLVEELHADVNQRDQNGYTPLHHAAARGDNEMILYLVSKGADPKAVSTNFRTTADMANGPVQRLRPFPETIALLEKLGSKNSHRCTGC
jgi:ankyrin repeat protein